MNKKFIVGLAAAALVVFAGLSTVAPASAKQIKIPRACEWVFVDKEVPFDEQLIRDCLKKVILATSQNQCVTFNVGGGGSSGGTGGRGEQGPAGPTGPTGPSGPGGNNGNNGGHDDNGHGNDPGKVDPSNPGNGPKNK